MPANLTDKTLITLTLEHFALIGSSDNANLTWRERAEFRAQEVVDEVWEADAWDFKSAESAATVTLSSGSSTADAPADLDIPGENGGLYVSGDSEKLRYLSTGLLNQAFEINAETGRPRAYCIRGRGDDGISTFAFDVTADQTYSLKLYYDTTPPLIIDPPQAPTLVLAAGTELEIGAYRYKYTYLAGTVESEPSEFTAVTTTNGNERVTVTIGTSANPAVTARKIYRTVVGTTTPYKLVATVSDNTTTSYLDQIPDASLGAEAPTGCQLARIPAQYHRPVIQRGLIAKLAIDLNRQDSAQFKAEYEQALGRMKSRRQMGLEDDERILIGGVSAYEQW